MVYLPHRTPGAEQCCDLTSISRVSHSEMRTPRVSRIFGSTVLYGILATVRVGPWGGPLENRPTKHYLIVFESE